MHAMNNTSSTGPFRSENCTMSGTSPASPGTSRVSPSRIARVRRCSCVAGKRRGRPFGKHAQLGVRLLPRDAGSQPADDADRTPFERFVRGAKRQWRPGLVVDRVPETVRHHADHGRRPVPQCHDRSDDVAPTAEQTLPHVVAEHDHAGCARPLVGVEQAAAEQGRHTRRAERAGGELRRPDRLRRRVAGDGDCACPCGTPPARRSCGSRAAIRGSRARGVARARSSGSSVSRSGRGDRLRAAGSPARGACPPGRTSPPRCRSRWPAPVRPRASGPGISGASAVRACSPAVRPAATAPSRRRARGRGWSGRLPSARRGRQGRRGRIEPAGLQLLPLHVEVEAQLVVELAFVSIALEQVAEAPEEPGHARTPKWRAGRGGWRR